MRDSTPLSILMFPQRRFPTDHAMLEAVYTRELPSRGHRVTWVMERETGSTGGRETWNGTDVHLLPNPESMQLPRALRPFVRFRRTLTEARRISAQQGFDVVQVRNELAGAAVARVLRRDTGMRFVYQASFPLADYALETRESQGLTALRRRAALSAKSVVQRNVLRAADLVLAISDRMRDEMIASGMEASRVVSFPLGVDTSFVPSDDARRRARARLGLGDRPTIIYFGALDRVRRLEILLDIVRMVRQRVPDLVCLVLGSALRTQDEHWLREQAASRALDDDRVRWLGRVPRAEVAEIVQAADVSVSPIPPVPLYRVASPTKVLESLGLAVPVVGNLEIHDQREILERSGGGRAVPYDAASMSEAIVELLADLDAARARGRRGREYVVATRSYAALADVVEASYYRMLGVPSTSRIHA